MLVVILCVALAMAQTVHDGHRNARGVLDTIFAPANAVVDWINTLPIGPQGK